MIDLSKPTQGGAVYEIELYRDDGLRLGILDRIESFVAVNITSETGVFNIVFPDNYDSDMLRPEQQVWIWRKPQNGIRRFVFGGLIKKIEMSISGNNTKTVICVGESYNGLLSARIFFGNDQPRTDVAQETVELVVSVVCELTPGVYYKVPGVTRTQTNYSNGFSTVTVRTYPANVLDWLYYMSNYLRSIGEYMFFDFIATASNVFEFRLYKNQPGRDLTIGQPGGIVFSVGAGNLSEIKLSDDYTGEINTGWKQIQSGNIIADGAGPKGFAAFHANRFVETFHSMRDGIVSISANTQLNSEGYKFIYENRPHKAIFVKLRSVPGSVYGIDWEFGDKVNVLLMGRLFETVIRAVTFGIDNQGNEILEAAVEITL